MGHWPDDERWTTVVNLQYSWDLRHAMSGNAFFRFPCFVSHSTVAAPICRKLRLGASSDLEESPSLPGFGEQI